MNLQNGLANVFGCNEWNTCYEEKVVKRSDNKKELDKKVEVVSLNDVEQQQNNRISTGFTEIDRVLGGGFVKGSLILLSGEPGIGKSTLILQICDKTEGEGKVLYVSGEESAEQIKIRADRLKINNDNILFLGETNIDIIEEEINKVKPKLVIIDSIQTMYSTEITAAARKC